MSAVVEPMRFTDIQGRVTAFDEAAGHGMIDSDDGARVFFHCTQLADGTRTIPVGTAVAARMRPIGLGEWEAAGVRRISR